MTRLGAYSIIARLRIRSGKAADPDPDPSRNARREERCRQATGPAPPWEDFGSEPRVTTVFKEGQLGTTWKANTPCRAGIGPPFRVAHQFDSRPWNGRGQGFESTKCTKASKPVSRRDRPLAGTAYDVHSRVCLEPAPASRWAPGGSVPTAEGHRTRPTRGVCGRSRRLSTAAARDSSAAVLSAGSRAAQYVASSLWISPSMPKRSYH